MPLPPELTPLKNNERYLAALVEKHAIFSKPGGLKYLDFLKISPNIQTNFFDANGPEVKVGKASELSEEQKQKLLSVLREFKDWRKGPFSLFGIEIDSEWRSDFKWQRLALQESDLKGKRILDIGCNNGYFMFKMLPLEPKWVLGIDPVLHYQSQFQLLQNYIKSDRLYFEMLGIEHLEFFPKAFDVIFSLGILYHHRNPLQQLLDLKSSLAPGGTLYLETIGVPGEDSNLFFPPDRYAQMKNVYFLPTLKALTHMLERCKYKTVEVISKNWQGVEEQRSTEWAPGHSYRDFLDPNDCKRTIEGHSAPERFLIKAKI